jgi:hypothetical protein
MRRKYALALIPIMIIVFLIALLPAPMPSQAQIVVTATLDPLFPTPTPLPTATPLLTPQPTAAAPGCGSLYPIEIGDEILVRGGVNIRAIPSVNGPLMTTTVTDQTAGWYVIVDGPVCADNYTWWYVYGSFQERISASEVVVTEVSGWMADHNLSMSFILEYVPEEGLCPDALNLVVGEEIELVRNVRIRDAPSLSGLVWTVAPAGSVARVLDAQPVCADGYVWRNVRVQVLDLVYDGWMAEGTRLTEEGTGASFIDVDLDCYPPLNLPVGSRGVVDYLGTQPKNLRAAPSRSAEIYYSLVKGIPLEIIGGPVCAEGMNWWHVNVLGTTPVSGWLAEGRRGDYWIAPFADHPDMLPYRWYDQELPTHVPTSTPRP